MGYEPTTWHGGDVLSAEAMNKIENGIANAGSGALEVRVIENGDTQTLDKTWQEIYDAFPNVYIFYGNYKESIGAIYEWYVSTWSTAFRASSANGYPSSGGEIAS